MKNDSILTIRLMGGVDEIGSNMTVFETKKEYIIIDYGILFPYEDFYDINYLVVDYSDLDPKKKATLFITHGHEDHIGAITHIVNYFQNFKVYAPEFAAVLIRKKLLQRKLSCPIKVYEEDTDIQFEGFKLHPVHVTHSIPHTFGVIFKGQGLSILFISDFKYDENPLYEKAFNVKKIKEHFNSEELRICLLDSTNILNPSKTTSERDVVSDLDHLIGQKKRTFITLFSSNIFRLKTIFELAKKNNKKITAVGRSIYNYLEAAKEAKILNYDDYDFIAEDGIDDPNRSDLVVLLTGSQGDFMGALKRISNGDHKKFKFTEKDQVIFSSKPIPGNEKKISRIYNDITRYGAQIVTTRDFNIHASGHPGQEDLKQLMSHLNPSHYIPIHGETYFLKKHAEFAKNVLKVNSIMLGNFNTIFINKNLEVDTRAEIKKEPIIIHGSYLPIEKESIAQRRKIATMGCVFVSLNSKDKSLKISHQGLPFLIQEHLEEISRILIGCAYNEFKNAPESKRIEGVRVKTRQLFKNHLGYRPIAIVHHV